MKIVEYSIITMDKVKTSMDNSMALGKYSIVIMDNSMKIVEYSIITVDKVKTSMDYSMALGKYSIVIMDYSMKSMDKVRNSSRPCGKFQHHSGR